MADETPNETEEAVEGTSASAEVPDENEIESTEVEETPAEGMSADAGASADAESPREETEVEVTEKNAEDVSEASASEDEAAAEAAGEGEEPVDEAAADGEGLGDSAPAEAPRKRKRLPRRLRPQKTRPKPVRSTGRKPIVRLEKPEGERGRRQERQGKVVSDAMEKTIVVQVAVVKAHPRYKKVVRRSVKFHAHDERSEAKVGDLVRIVETRPLSKTKRWRLAEILEAAK